MPGLLSGSLLRKGGSGQFIELSSAMPQLPQSPTTSTGYTLITSDKLVTTYASSLGNIQFTAGTMYSNVTGTNLQLVGTGTLSVLVSGGTTSTSTNTGALIVEGGLGVWGDANIGGTLAGSTATLQAVKILGTSTAISTATGALQVRGGVGIGDNLYVGTTLNVRTTATFGSDVHITNDAFVLGEFRVDGSGGVFLSPVAASVSIQPTLGGTIIIQPSVTGRMNNMIVGEFLPQNSYFSNSYASNFIGLATTSTNINGGEGGSIPYQTESGVTAFINIGSTNTVLISNGTTATWANSADLTVSTATNINGGVLGSMPYQESPGVTAFINIGSTNTVLISNGTTATWANSADLTVSTATYANTVFVDTVTDDVYRIILSTSTNSYGTLEADEFFTYSSGFRQMSVPSIVVSGSIYSQYGIPDENNLLYTPRSTISLGAPPDNSPRLGDFWIDPSQGVVFEYVQDGGNKIWLQFTGL